MKRETSHGLTPPVQPSWVFFAFARAIRFEEEEPRKGIRAKTDPLDKNEFDIQAFEQAWGKFEEIRLMFSAEQTEPPKSVQLFCDVLKPPTQIATYQDSVAAYEVYENRRNMGYDE